MKAFCGLQNEYNLSLEVQCPEHIEQTTFEDVFENVFKVVYGFPLCITKENFESVLSICSQLDNSVIFEECFEYLNTFNFDNIETILWILQFSEFFPSLSVNVSKISSNFETIKSHLLTKISPSAMSTILKYDGLTIESENSLFEFLFEYSKKWSHKSLSLFENVCFEYLSEVNLEKFIELHSQYEPYFQFQFRSSLFESFLFLLKSKPRSLPKHRYLSHSASASASAPVSNTIPLLFECRRQNQRLQSKITKLQSANSTLSAAKINLLNQNQSITQSNSSLKNELDQSLFTNTALNHEITALTNNISKLNLEKNTLDSQIYTLSSEKANLQQTIANLISDKTKLTSDLKDLQTQNSNLQ
jgi:hypothetical protein